MGLHILHVVPTFFPATFYGGPIFSVYNLCSQLAASDDIRLTVLTTDSSGPSLQNRLLTEKTPSKFEPGFDVFYCFKTGPGLFAPSLLFRLVKIIVAVDVVHLTGVYSFTTFPVLILCRLIGKPLVWSPRGAFQRWKGSRNIWLKSCWDKLCQILAPNRIIIHVTSKEEADESMGRIPQFQSIIIPNGVSIPNTIKQETGHDNLQLLFLSRIDPKKGLDQLFLACRFLQQNTNKSWSLIVAGSGNPQVEQSFKQLVEEYNLSQNIQFVGHVIGKQKSDLFAESDVFILPSFTENFGLVIAEALAHGVPVIASKGTPWSRIEEIGCGLVVENDPESLAKAILKMFSLPRKEMGIKGREWMSKEFGLKIMTDKMIKCYKDLLENQK